MWIQVALFVASLLISALLQPKPKEQKPAAFEDFDFPTAEDGTPQIVVFGDVWLTDWTVIGAGNYRSKKIKTKQKSLFGSKEVDAGFKYFMGLHFGLCNSLDDIVEIKVADKSIWKGTVGTENLNVLNIDQPQIFGGDSGEGGIQGTLWVMRGASDQQPLPQLQAMLGGDVPAYRGVATAFFDGQICSNSPYPKAWSLRVRRTNAGWDTGVWYPEKLTIWLKDNTIKAMNAAHIIYEAQTNRTWGRGFSESQLDVASFKSVADQLYSEGFGICLAWRRQESLQEFIQQIIDQIGAALYVDRTTGLWKLILIRDNYNASTLPSYGYSTGLLRVENDDNSANDLVTNQTIVTYRDPITNEDKPARAENLAAIQKNGVILEQKSYVGIPTVEIAGRLAARDMKIAHSALKRFKVVLDRRAYALQPASVFKLSLPDRGIESMVFRAVRVEHDNLTNGEITVTALQDVFGLPSTNYIKEQPSLWQAPNLLAKPVTVQKLFEVPYAHLLTMYSKTQLSEDMINSSIFSLLEEKPTTLHLDFEALTKLSTENNYVSQGNFDFVDTAELLESVSQSSAQTVLKLNQLDSDLQIGTCALLNEEIVKIEALNLSQNEVTIMRGCIDTVPMQHAINSKIWFYDHQSIVLEQLIKLGQTLQTKALTRTSQTQLSEDQASSISIIAKQRHARPYTPANIKLNDFAYPATLNSKLQKIEWFGRNRLTQADSVVGQLAGHQQLEDKATYSLRVYKKVTMNSSYVLVSELKDLTATIAYANDDKAITPGVNDFFNLTLNKGHLTAVNSPYQALKTTQRIVLSRAQVGQFYGLLLDPNAEGSNGFPVKYVEEEYLPSDTTISFLNRLKDRIVSTLTSIDKTALKYGWYHAQTGGYRCEGSSGRVLEISHKYAGQTVGNIIHFVLYDLNNDVLFHHQFTNAELGEFYFDAELERCFMWFGYEGTVDLNQMIASNNPYLRTFDFDDIKTNGIAFTRTPSTVPICITRNNFAYHSSVLWCATPSTDRKAPIVLSKLNIETLALEMAVNYINPSTLTSPVSDSIANDLDVGKIVLTGTNLYYLEDRYLDARYPNDIRYVQQRVAKFNRTSGTLIETNEIAVDVSSDLAVNQQRNFFVGKYYTQDGVIQTQVEQFALPPTASNQFNIVGYSLDTGEINKRKSIDYKQNQKFFYNPNTSTGMYQFYSAGFRSNGQNYITDLIIDLRNLNEYSYADSILVHSVNIALLPEQNKVGFPEAAYMDVEFDVPGQFYFETTSSATAGTGPSGSVLFADVSDAVVVKVEVWSVRDGLDSWQKQILEVPINV